MVPFLCYNTPKVGDYMNNTFIVCDNCGAKCDIHDKFCKACFSTLSETEFEPVIEGIEDVELINYIDKKSDYYLEKFSQKKEKWFIQWNWAALFFGPTWFFYRRMQKIAIVYAAILILLSSLLGVVLPVVFNADVDEYFAAKEAYSDYINSGGERYLYKEPPYSTYMIGLHPTYEKLRDDLKDAQNKIRLIEFLINAPVFAVNILFRLFANSIYKNHIITNIHSNKKGTSMKNAIGGLVAVNLVTWIVSALLLQIPVVSRFFEAASTLINWL